ncbi:MAG TPA: hypothetical protein VFC56_02980 [Stellaceae bacterium]|nr:hypothetical protein [Stellaceae bacterium]
MAVRRSILALIAGSVLFAALIAVELTAGPPAATALAVAPQQSDTNLNSDSPHAPRSDQLVAAALTRPLFSVTRRPPAETVSGPADSGLAGARLTGIVIAPDRHLAIFAVGGAKPLELSEGEKLSGWQIDAIAAGEVSLSGPNGNKTLLPTLDPLLAPAPQGQISGLGRPRPAPATAASAGTGQRAGPRVPAPAALGARRSP